MKAVSERSNLEEGGEWLRKRSPNVGSVDRYEIERSLESLSMLGSRSSRALSR